MEPRQLPLFENLRPDLSELKISGRGPGRSQAYRMGQTVYALVMCEVSAITHERKGSDDLLIRSHKLDVQDLRIMDVTAGRQLLSDLDMAEVEGAAQSSLASLLPDGVDSLTITRDSSD